MACLFGGNGGDYQYRSMLGQFDVMVFCPGRLLNALSRGDTNLHRASYIVVDEADDLLANRAPDIMDNALSQIWPQTADNFSFFRAARGLNSASSEATLRLALLTNHSGRYYAFCLQRHTTTCSALQENELLEGR